MEIFVKNIIPTNEYALIIQYETGEIKYIDLKDEIFKYDCWKELRNIEYFNLVYVDEFGDGPCWPNNIEMNPIRIYNQSINMLEIIQNAKSNKNNQFYE